MFSTAPHFVYLLAATAGAVVMPFMLFYQASATAEKKSKFLWASRFETLVGAVVSEVIMVVILMATVGVDPKSFSLNSVGVLAKGLSSVADGYSPIPICDRIDRCGISCIGSYLSCKCVGSNRGYRSRSQSFLLDLSFGIIASRRSSNVFPQSLQSTPQLDGRLHIRVDWTRHHIGTRCEQQEDYGNKRLFHTIEDWLLGQSYCDSRFRCFCCYCNFLNEGTCRINAWSQCPKRLLFYYDLKSFYQATRVDAITSFLATRQSGFHHSVNCVCRNRRLSC